MVEDLRPGTARARTAAVRRALRGYLASGVAALGLRDRDPHRGAGGRRLDVSRPEGERGGDRLRVHPHRGRLRPPPEGSPLRPHAPHLPPARPSPLRARSARRPRPPEPRLLARPAEGEGVDDGNGLAELRHTLIAYDQG